MWGIVRGLSENKNSSFKLRLQAGERIILPCMEEGLSQVEGLPCCLENVRFAHIKLLPSLVVLAAVEKLVESNEELFLPKNDYF